MTCTRTSLLLLVASVGLLLAVAELLCQKAWQGLVYQPLHGLERLPPRGLARMSVRCSQMNLPRRMGTSLENQTDAHGAGRPQTIKDAALQNMTLDQMRQDIPIWVLSMRKSQDRRANIAAAMAAAGVNFTFVEAIDGDNPAAVPPALVDYFWRGSGWDKHWHAGDHVARRKLALILSHHMMLQQVVVRNKPAILLEDDSLPLNGARWLEYVHAALQDLPADWDVLYLNACYKVLGEAITPRVSVLSSGLCLLGYIPSPRFAALAIAATQSFHAAPFDIMLDWLIKSHRVKAYVAEPCVLGFANFNSTVHAPPTSSSSRSLLQGQGSSKLEALPAATAAVQ